MSVRQHATHRLRVRKGVLDGTTGQPWWPAHLSFDARSLSVIRDLLSAQCRMQCPSSDKIFAGDTFRICARTLLALCAATPCSFTALQCAKALCAECS